MTALIIIIVVAIFLLGAIAYIKKRYEPFIDEAYDGDGSRRLVIWYTKHYPDHTEREYITIFKVA